jgi:hypothetical protein
MMIEAVLWIRINGGSLDIEKKNKAKAYRRRSDSTVSENAGIEPRRVAISALTVRRSNHSAGSRPQIGRSHSHSSRSHRHQKIVTKL